MQRVQNDDKQYESTLRKETYFFDISVVYATFAIKDAIKE